uniref:Uncharacterized protein n=1 Tax=Macrostomum lignano TaxID=282301 RepID=A0A1I8F9M7_9PLAT
MAFAKILRIEIVDAVTDRKFARVLRTLKMPVSSTPAVAKRFAASVYSTPPPLPHPSPPPLSQLCHLPPLPHPSSLLRRPLSQLWPPLPHPSPPPLSQLCHLCPTPSAALMQLRQPDSSARIAGGTEMQSDRAKPASPHGLLRAGRVPRADALPVDPVRSPVGPQPAPPALSNGSLIIEEKVLPEDDGKLPVLGDQQCRHPSTPNQRTYTFEKM